MFDKAPKKPVRGDYDRRWLSDDFFDLIIWYRPDDTAATAVLQNNAVIMSVAGYFIPGVFISLRHCDGEGKNSLTGSRLGEHDSACAKSASSDKPLS